MPEQNPEIGLDTSDLRGLLAAVRDFSPKLATQLRRDLRGVGDDVIARQRAILAGPLPKGVVVTGKRLTRVQAKGKRRAYSRLVNTYGETDRPHAGSYGRGLRKQIAAGLKVRVVAGKTRQGVELKTTGPRDGGYNMAKVWNRPRFRHPVFTDNGKVWVYQAGQPYFWGPIYDGGLEGMSERVDAAIARTLAAMGGGGD